MEATASQVSTGARVNTEQGCLYSPELPVKELAYSCSNSARECDCHLSNFQRLYVAVPVGFQVNTRAPAERTCSKEYYAIFSVAYKLIIGFAAVGIINAVFMQETFKVAASDDKLMMRQKAGT